METANKTKTIITLMLILLMGPWLILNAKPGKKITSKKYCLEITGRIAMSIKTKTKNGTVQLIENNVVVETKKIGAHETFKFLLEKNKEYGIKIIYEGLVERLVYISTSVPLDTINNKLHKFHFDLFPPTNEEVTPEQTDILDYPVALVGYNTIKSCFDFNLKYTTFIKNAYFNLDIFEGNRKKVSQKLN